jgi:hypothetical protein
MTTVPFDDGAQWQTLSLNLPDTQVADLVVEQNDLSTATGSKPRGSADADEESPRSAAPRPPPEPEPTVSCGTCAIPDP